MRALFALIFAGSGAAALVYQVTWTRLLTLQLGHGVAAASTVLAAFMGGLAAGSAAGGRIGARLAPAAALRAYAGLEIAIAGLALLLPFLIRALDPLLASAYDNGAGGTPFVVLRVGASLLLLSAPAAAMGATFPVAARWFVHHVSSAARDAGTLYAANTVGASLGALLAGFVLLPFLGLTGATWVAVGLNALAAGGAWLIAGRSVAAVASAGAVRADARASASPPSKKRAAKSAPASARPGMRLHPTAVAAAALGISGFASLTLQVVWTRLLAMILGPTTYAFSVIVAVFIAGLAVGAAIASRLASRVRQPLAALAVCLALSVGLAALSASLIDRGLLAVATVVADPQVTFRDVLWSQARLALGLLAPMTVAFGAAFPFAVAVATRRDDTIAADLGLIYAVNTAGAIAGALLAGFAFIPAVGLHGTLRLVIVAGALGAAALVALEGARGRLRIPGAVLAAAVLALGVWLPEWDRMLLSSGA